MRHLQRKRATNIHRYLLREKIHDSHNGWVIGLVPFDLAATVAHVQLSCSVLASDCVADGEHSTELVVHSQ